MGRSAVVVAVVGMIEIPGLVLADRQAATDAAHPALLDLPRQGAAQALVDGPVLRRCR
jgi:hypothetical protein